MSENKKFDFEKHIPKQEESEPEVEMSQEEQQEQFEAECIAEAERLEVGLEELQNSIDQFGGAEELQSYLVETQKKRDSEMEMAGGLTKKGALIGGLAGTFAAIAGTFAAAGIAGMGDGAFEKTVYNFAIENHVNISSMAQRLIENPEILAAAVATVPAMIGGMVGKIKERITKRKLNKEQDIDNLTGKMAGL